MNEQLKTLIANYKKTDWKALLRENLGEYHLKEMKPHLDFIKNFIDDIISSPYLQDLPPNQHNLLINILRTFQKHKSWIENYTDTSQNQSTINNIINFKQWILESCQSLSSVLDIQNKYTSDNLSTKPGISIKGEEFKKYILNEKKLHEALSKYNTATEEIEKKLKRMKQIESQLSEQKIREEASRYGGFFEKESEKNKKLSYVFGIGLLCFSFIACFFTYCFLSFDENITFNNIPELIIKGDLINKVFIFTIIVFLISVIKREYLALKHQYTLNRHRHNALSSHKEILNSIKKTENESDKEISNAVLLELTKAMFDPQDTGFVKDQHTSSENRVVEVSKSFFNNSKD